jgi:diguanylate cyclase (GGDEF)-like protein
MKDARVKALPTAVRLLRWALMLAVTVYVGWLVPFTGSARPTNGRDVWLSIAVLLMTTALMASRALLLAENRAAWTCLSAASACWTAGDVYFLLVVRNQHPMPSPSWADVGFLAVYPFVWCAVILLLRRQARALPAGVWLDGLVGGLAAAALASALALRPILAATGGAPTMVATNLSYPTADLLLLAMMAGVYALFGWRPPSQWLLLGGGLAGFAISDTEYLFRTATNTYVLGTPWDAGWPLGLGLVALAAWCRPTRTKRVVRLEGGGALLVPTLCGLLGLGLLAYGCFVPLPPVSVALATICVLGALMRTVLTFRELRTLSRVRREAATDDLTGLVNRREFYSLLATAFGERAPAGQLAVLLIDLDRFKDVNDSLGHHVGDALLQLVGQRLVNSLRAEDVLGRLGGDEFAALIDTGETGETAVVIAKRLRDTLQAPFHIDGVTLHIDASIGVAFYGESGEDGETLLRHADVAMYQAKASGTGWHIYSPELDAARADRFSTTEALRTALFEDQLVLHYQPKLDLSSGEVTGVEALVRWQHPQRGLIYPDEFLPLAETAGLMAGLTTVVLDQALRQCAAWRASGRELSVAVNLSPSNLLDQELPSLVDALLTGLGLPAAALHLEITESVIMTNPERSLAVLNQLHARGIRLAVDDYGAGYSSLTYLSALPISDLKLDKSFAIAMAGEGPPAMRARSIVQSTVTLAGALGLDLIAEGAETAQVLAALAELGCTSAQGYYIARPKPALEFDEWFAARNGAVVTLPAYPGDPQLRSG